MFVELSSKSIILFFSFSFFSCLRRIHHSSIFLVVVVVVFDGSKIIDAWGPFKLISFFLQSFCFAFSIVLCLLTFFLSWVPFGWDTSRIYLLCKCIILRHVFFVFLSSLKCYEIRFMGIGWRRNPFIMVYSGSLASFKGFMIFFSFSDLNFLIF